MIGRPLICRCYCRGCQVICRPQNSPKILNHFPFIVRLCPQVRPDESPQTYRKGTEGDQHLRRLIHQDLLTAASAPKRILAINTSSPS